MRWTQSADSLSEKPSSSMCSQSNSPLRHSTIVALRSRAYSLFYVLTFVISLNSSGSLACSSCLPYSTAFKQPGSPSLSASYSCFLYRLHIFTSSENQANFCANFCLSSSNCLSSLLARQAPAWSCPRYLAFSSSTSSWRAAFLIISEFTSARSLQPSYPSSSSLSTSLAVLSLSLFLVFLLKFCQLLCKSSILRIEFFRRVKTQSQGCSEENRLSGRLVQESSTRIFDAKDSLKDTSGFALNVCSSYSVIARAFSTYFLNPLVMSDNKQQVQSMQFITEVREDQKTSDMLCELEDQAQSLCRAVRRSNGVAALSLGLRMAEVKAQNQLRTIIQIYTREVLELSRRKDYEWLLSPGLERETARAEREQQSLDRIVTSLAAQLQLLEDKVY